MIEILNNKKQTTFCQILMSWIENIVWIIYITECDETFVFDILGIHTNKSEFVHVLK